MNFIPKKKFFPIFILCIIGLSTVSAADLYGWSGKLEPGDKVLINDLILALDTDKNNGELALIIKNSTNVIAILRNGQFIKVNDMTISFSVVNDYCVVSITSNEFFNVLVPTPEQDTLESLREENEKLKRQNENLRKAYASLLSENKKLKQRISELEKKTQDNDFNSLQLKILNLTKENRKLKEELKNLTEKYNALKGENDYLKSQLETYKAVFSGLVQQVGQQTEKNYIEEAKDSEKDAKRLWWAFAISIGLVGGIGILMYRKKRKYELE